MSLLRHEELANGLSVRFIDCSNRYYGDYWRLKVEVRCALILQPELFVGEADPQGACARARQLLGDQVVFTRSLEKMGVDGGQLESARTSLVEGFVRNAFPYLGQTEFPARLVVRELSAKRKSVFRRLL